MCSPILFTKSLGLASRHLRAALRQSIKASMAGSWGVGEGTRKMVIWGWFMLPLSLYMWFYVVTCSTYIVFFYDLLKCLEWIITSYQSRRWVVYHLGMVYGIGFTSWTGLTQQRTDWTNPIQGKLISATWKWLVAEFHVGSLQEHQPYSLKKRHIDKPPALPPFFLTFYNEIQIWLVVSKMFYGMSSFPLTNSYFSRWLLHHQPEIVGSLAGGYPQSWSSWQAPTEDLAKLARQWFERPTLGALRAHSMV